MRKNEIIDILVWIAFAIVFVYFLFKVLGIIHSPITLDIIALISAAFFVGRYAMKLDYVFRDIRAIKLDVRELDKKCPIFKEKGTKVRS